MNQPTNTQFEELRKRVERLEQQQTEPIKVTVERRQTEVERVLDNHTEMLREHSDLLQLIYNQSGTQNADIAVLKHEMQGARADITSLKATLSDHGEMLKSLKATQDTHSKRMDTMDGKLDLILQLLQKRGE